MSSDVLHEGSDVALQVYTCDDGLVRFILSSYVCDVSDFAFIGRMLKVMQGGSE